MHHEDLLRRLAALLTVAVALIGLPLASAHACSTLAFPDGERPMLAFNFDFAETGAGFVMLNPKGIGRSSVMEGRAARWQARFGSVTVNQIGPGMPTAGMNTEGLVVTLMWNDAAVYAGSPPLPIVSELEFIQYLLDTSGSVDEALARLGAVRIEGLVPIHYFLFDRTGAAAVVTPTRHGLEVHAGDMVPVPVLTNTGYDAALDHLCRFRGFGGGQPLPEVQRPGGPNSLDRFAIGAGLTGDATLPLDTGKAFAALDRLANPDTRWQLVFEPRAATLRLRLGPASRALEIDLNQQDFSCRGAPVGASLHGLTPGGDDNPLAAVTHAELAASLGEVLSSMSRTAHLGRPEVARGLAAGLIAAGSCTPE